MTERVTCPRCIHYWSKTPNVGCSLCDGGTIPIARLAYYRLLGGPIGVDPASSALGSSTHLAEEAKSKVP